MLNSRFLTGVLLSLTVSVMSAQAAQIPGEIDITAAVRAADAGTTQLDAGGCLSGYTVDNAFGIGETKEDRIMLTNAYNRIIWTIAETFEEGKPIVVTKYTIKRTSPASGAADPFGQKRAPKNFFFQGSYNGSDWITLSEVSTTWDAATLEKTFEIDPLYYGDYRKYRFVSGATNAEATDSVKCSFQYIKVYGTVGDWAPLAAAAKPMEYLYNRGVAASVIPIYMPTLDSKIELDVALTDVAGTQAILSAGNAGWSYQMRLFHTEADGWAYYYGDDKVKHSSGKKASKNARYHVIIDGPVVKVNGQEVINAGTKLNVNAGTCLTVACSVGNNLSELYNVAKVKYWSLKAYDKDGNLALDLRPMLDRDGVGVWQDDLTKRLFGGSTVDSTKRLTEGWRITEYIVDVTGYVRNESSVAPTVTLVEGTAHADYPFTNLFTTVQNSANRALFTSKRAVVQYDIPDTYHSGWPMVLTHYGVIPAGFGTGGSDPDYAKKRAPNKIELWASTDGGEGWDGWVKIHERHCGLGPGFFGKGEIRDLAKGADDKVNFKGCLGPTFKIPEENRGDYRHYRFVMDGSSAESWDTVQLSLQELRFFGYDGGFEPRYQPVSFLQNGLEQQNVKNTYVKTGVKPASAEGFTIEIKGSFTKIDATSCLFCARDNNSANTWTLFLLNSALRLDCKTAGQTTGFRPDQNAEYTFKVTGNELSVYDANGTQVHASTSGSMDFTPGSEIVLMASHKAASSGWDNQARFKMRSCKITDRFGGVVFDGVPCERTSDGKAGLFDRVTRKFMVADGEAGARHGDSVDCDFTQRGRTVTMTSALDAAECVPGTVDFTFADNQMIAAELFAAFDNVRKGTDFDAWASKVKLGDVTTGIDNLTNVSLENPGNYKFVKFFVRDPLDRACSQTRIYRTFVPGMAIIVK